MVFGPAIKSAPPPPPEDAAAATIPAETPFIRWPSKPAPPPMVPIIISFIDGDTGQDLEIPDDDEADSKPEVVIVVDKLVNFLF